MRTCYRPDKGMIGNSGFSTEKSKGSQNSGLRDKKSIKVLTVGIIEQVTGDLKLVYSQASRASSSLRDLILS